MELNIKEIRQKLNLTQAELAQMVGTSIQTISNWERLGNIPTPMRSKLENLFSEKSQKRDATEGEKKVTDIYLRRDFSKIWEANRQVLDVVFGKKKERVNGSRS